MKLFLTGTTLALALSPSFSTNPFAQEVDVPHRFTAGTPAKASEVNENFEALVTAAREAKDLVDSVGVEVTALGTDVAGLSSAVTANTEAASDLDARLRPAGTIVVAKENGDFSSIVAALDSVTDASLENPVQVYIHPGRYTETGLANVREGVHLVGAGAGASVLVTNRTGNTPSEAAAAIRLFDGGRISNLGVVNSGSSALSIGIVGFDLSGATLIDGVEVLVDGTGGTGHFGMHVTDGDLIIRDSKLEAAGATTVNTGFASLDNGGPFAQPQIEGSTLLGRGVNSGMGFQISRTAMTVTDSLIDGDQTGGSATISGISRIHHSRVESLGLNPVYTTNGSASILSAGVGFVGGDPSGFGSSFRYVHCYGPSMLPIVNGDGSSVQ